MKRKIVWNDIRKNKLLSGATYLFMAVCAVMFALTGLLFTGLLGSINALMEQAKTSDFLQMHAGTVKELEIEKFAKENKNVKEYQIEKFLNLENGTITLGRKSLADNTQDNGVCVQNEKFDYLLGQENQMLSAKEGEVYVPICYKAEYGLKAGDVMQVGEEHFVIAGFLRDSQMNSMMASSKRFLVCESDYERLLSKGSEEYLIEFQLEKGADVNAFATEYADAGLPSNGPTITYSLIRMMNAISDGVMILVILLVSIGVLFITILCIRFTLVTKLEEDRTEIGMLKAIGINRKTIRQIYFQKFILLSLTGAVTGILAAYALKGPLSKGIQELYGTAKNGTVEILVAGIGVIVIEAILLLSVRRTLKQLEKLSAVEALLGKENAKLHRKKRIFSKQYAIVLLVVTIGVFMMTIPQNLYHTMASSQFVTYMGIGDSEIRIDVRQSNDIMKNTKEAEQLLRNDKNVKQYVTLVTKSYQILLPDGSGTHLNIETGNHNVFPVSYAVGKAPAEKNEIAISYLYAEEMQLSIGDKLNILVQGKEQEYRICGIYSDITNGGKTAKAIEIPEDAPVMWSVFYVSLQQNGDRQQWITKYQNQLSEKEINGKVIGMKEYVTATYGQTIEEVGRAAYLVVGVAVMIMFLVVVLFVRMIVAKERYQISLHKALGFTGKEIKNNYWKQSLKVTFIGVLLGAILGDCLGEKLCGVALKSLGAVGFQFVIDWKMVCIVIPVITFFTVVLAVKFGLNAVNRIKPYECCMGKE